MEPAQTAPAFSLAQAPDQRAGVGGFSSCRDGQAARVGTAAPGRPGRAKLGSRTYLLYFPLRSGALGVCSITCSFPSVNFSSAGNPVRRLLLRRNVTTVPFSWRGNQVSTLTPFSSAVVTLIGVPTTLKACGLVM